ncbi:MAG TPA: carboxyl transferase domain-containing protein [Euzebya sp.]|nr:carboxyl transferase domain-containing protein [Euzebya sp.]
MSSTDPAAELHSPLAATVAHVVVEVGQSVTAQTTVLYLEIMKMEQPVKASGDGIVSQVHVTAGDSVEVGQLLVTLAANPAAPPAADPADSDPTGHGHVRPDLAAVRARRTALSDEARPDAVASRHEHGMRTARENIAALVDAGSFSEYGGLAIAAQRNRRPLEELIRRTPADGLVTGTATVNADLVGPRRAHVAVAAYDYTVLAGTQGLTNHAKKDRLFRLAARQRMPVVLFAEGGGGRPGDTDALGGSWLAAEAFELFARLSGQVPLIAIVNGRCFAGNAALAGTADVIIATQGSSLGMAGPAMIEGGGLGSVDPDDIGPMAVQAANGVVDVVVADEAAAAATARRYLSYTQGPIPPPDEPHDQVVLRDTVPANRKRVYDMGEVVRTLADPDSVLELRAGCAPGMLTAFARVGGRPVGVIANVPTHLGGAIDADGADSAVQHLQLCDAYGLPVIVLCDTPGFMVGPEAERAGGVRRFSRMFKVGAHLQVPIIAIITRKAYGLGAQAMLGGHLKVPVLTLGWPTAELGPMGLEGAVRLGFRRELDAEEDPAERERHEAQLIEVAYAQAAGLNVATFAEIDDVIDPADTRKRILQALVGAGADLADPHPSG